MTRFQKKCDRQEGVIDKLETRVMEIEKKHKNHNMLIEGLRETNNENLRMIIDEMLTVFTESARNERQLTEDL